MIDHVPADHALATWLARRLQLAGFQVWCYGTAPLAGEDADESVRILIDKRANRYLPVLSAASIADPDFLSRCSIAAEMGDIVVPCSSCPIDVSTLSKNLRKLNVIRFADGWATALRDLLGGFATQGIKPSVDAEKGRVVALRSYVPDPVIRPSPERVFANVFRVHLPQSILVCELKSELDKTQMSELREKWAFSIVSPRKLLSFDDPPPEVQIIPQTRTPEHSWEDVRDVEGKRSFDLVKELVRRSLDVACCQAGLVRCEDRDVLYFPHEGKAKRITRFTHVDGRKTWVSVTGEKTHWTPAKKTQFRYQLSPSFQVGCDSNNTWWVTTRIYVRVTDSTGKPFQLKEIGRYRKQVTRAWWNKQWLARTIGVMQALSQQETKISIGNGKRRIEIDVAPLEWSCPVSIDVEAVDRIGDFQEEMAGMRFNESGPDEEH